jgi:hypothetical protein
LELCFSRFGTGAKAQKEASPDQDASNNSILALQGERASFLPFLPFSPYLPL